MSLLNSLDIDSLWDYSQPAHSEAKFQEVLLQISEEDPLFLELLTQIARAQGLQQKFAKAQHTLDQVEKRLRPYPSHAGIRYALERGRVFNSSGHPDEARPFFEDAYNKANFLAEDFYAVDALHMLAIIATEQESLDLNLQAIDVAESSRQEKARNWLGSLYNNNGWSYHDIEDYETALEMFKKAEAWQRVHGNAVQLRIAQWTIGRTLRSLGRIEEALKMQRTIQKTLEGSGASDGFVMEEIGECLLTLNRASESRPYFAKAFKELSQDSWLVKQEPKRLQRLKSLSK